MPVWAACRLGLSRTHRGRSQVVVCSPRRSRDLAVAVVVAVAAVVVVAVVVAVAAVVVVAVVVVVAAVVVVAVVVVVAAAAPSFGKPTAAVVAV